MPANNNDPWTIRRIGYICCITIAIYLGGITPVMLTREQPGVGEIAFWSATFFLGGFFFALWVCKPDWRCRLPQWIRDVFFRALREPWQETRRVGEYVEMYCPRCQKYRYGRMTRHDSVEGWEKGRLPESVLLL